MPPSPVQYRLGLHASEASSTINWSSFVAVVDSADLVMFSMRSRTLDFSAAGASRWPVPARLVVAVHQHHACVCLRHQRVYERHAHGARADHQVIGLDGVTYDRQG